MSAENAKTIVAAAAAVVVAGAVVFALMKDDVSGETGVCSTRLRDGGVAAIELFNADAGTCFDWVAQQHGFVRDR